MTNAPTIVPINPVRAGASFSIASSIEVVVEILDAARQSAKEGRTVYLLR